MAETTRRPLSRDRWRLQHAGRFEAWADAEEPCRHCGRAVDLRRPHVGAQVVRDAGDPGPRKRGVDSRRLAFCGRDCFDAWVADGE
jgi:hypothetical protein